MQIALDILEPFGRIARGVLQLQNFQPALILVALESGLHVGSVCRYSASAMALSIASFEPEPTEKCAVAAASPSSTTLLMAPAFAQHAIEIEPRRTAQVTRIRHQLVAAEILGEDFLAGRDGFFGRHPVEAGARAMSLPNIRR